MRYLSLLAFLSATVSADWNLGQRGSQPKYFILRREIPVIPANASAPAATRRIPIYASTISPIIPAATNVPLSHNASDNVALPSNLTLTVSTTTAIFTVSPKSAPTGYSNKTLEPYAVYHYRYIAIGCPTKKNTTFFQECCHPRNRTYPADVYYNTSCAASTYVNANQTLLNWYNGTNTTQTFNLTGVLSYGVPLEASQAIASVAAPARVTLGASIEVKGATVQVEEAQSTEEPTPQAVTAASVQEEPSPTTSATPKKIITIKTSHKGTTASPKPTTTVQAQRVPEVTPETTTVKAAPTASPSSSISPSPSPSDDGGDDSDGDDNGSDIHTGGQATFFTQNGVAGACGKVHSDSDYICAMDYRTYGDVNAQSSWCGKQIEITRVSDGAKVTVTVADACPTCNNANSIDLSVGAFTQIATEEEGMVDITWRVL